MAVGGEPRFFKTAGAFRQWLQRHAGTRAELVVGFYKVGSGRASMTWPESVDEALCFGWIDGVRARIDEHSYRIRFTPRRKGSIWSHINIARAEALIAQRRMQPGGLAAFAARTELRSGVYSYERQDVPALTPEQLQRFRQARAAWAYFESTPPGYRRTITRWVVSAKQAATRARRLDALIEACRRRTRLLK